MSKKHFIALADVIRNHNRIFATKFLDSHISELADFCKAQNSNFNRERWLSYIADECGPNGGSKK